MHSGFPPDTAEAEVRKELAVTLYARQVLPLGKARQLTDLSRRDFEALLGERQVPRYYSEADLEEDLDHALGSSDSEMGATVRPSLHAHESPDERDLERFAGLFSGQGDATQALLEDRRREKD